MEDGRNMADFLIAYEFDCLEEGVPQHLWGLRIRKHLRGDAFRFYFIHLRRPDLDLHDWEDVKRRLVQNFCRQSREMVLAKFHSVKWFGDHVIYINQFAKATTQAASLSSGELVDAFLSKVPRDIQAQLTKFGTQSFSSWNDAATALCALLEPLSILHERQRNILQSAEAAFLKFQFRTGQGDQRGASLNQNEDRCQTCQGNGHRDINCPLKRPGFKPRAGTTCRLCGGRGHFIKECSSHRTGYTSHHLQPITSGQNTRAPNNVTGKLLMLSNDDSLQSLNQGTCGQLVQQQSTRVNEVSNTQLNDTA